MKYTSAEANKLLKSIQGRISDITRKEDLTASFRVASGEDVESLTHTLPGFDGLTIDQALVLIPQVRGRITKLRSMSGVLPKQRIVDRYNSANYVDYLVSNYDIEEAEQAYVEAKELLASLHLALDTVNTTETMEIDIVLED